MSSPRGALLVLGLTGENVTRLMADEPILVEHAELVEMGLAGKDFEIVLMGGKDEKSIAAKLGKDIENPQPGERVVGD